MYSNKDVEEGEGRREGEREEWREGGREGGADLAILLLLSSEAVGLSDDGVGSCAGGRHAWSRRKGGKEEVKEGGTEGRREGGREGGRVKREVGRKGGDVRRK
jgi:hypothetical protein